MKKSTAVFLMMVGTLAFCMLMTNPTVAKRLEESAARQKAERKAKADEAFKASAPGKFISGWNEMVAKGQAENKAKNAAR